jgi:hypothetical protein
MGFSFNQVAQMFGRNSGVPVVLNTSFNENARGRHSPASSRFFPPHRHGRPLPRP